MNNTAVRPGQVVSLRTRLWKVNYVDGDVVSLSSLDGRERQPRRFHLGLEDITDGAMPLPDPKALGPQSLQRLLIDAQRMSLLHGTAPILGLQRSRAIPTDYQMVPLLMALGSARVRLAIFDDVGTGKTIEAGLVVSELLARGKARRILIVVPANLRDQWAEALDHFFHIDSTIISGTVLTSLERRLLPGQSVWGAHDVVIASIDYLKTKTEQVLAHPWDLVVIDEAHLCARPHTSGRASAPDMARYQFAERAAAHARHLLLLTATPHNGYSDSFSSLFSMLDPNLLRPEGIDRAAARRSHVVQRRRADIEDWYATRGGDSPFPQRNADEDLVSLDNAPQMAQLLDSLREYAGQLFETADRTVDRWIAAHLQKRALSSPEALRRSLRSREAALLTAAATEARQDTEQAAREATTDRLFTEDDEGDAASLDRLASGLARDEELQWLADLREQAKQVTAARDPKLQTLLRLIPERLSKHPDSRRMLVFTKFKDTLDYLVGELRKAAKSRAKGRRLPDDLEVFAIHGQMNLAQRREVFTAFEASPCAVLVATDCISEGLNLQRACAELVHYELPWNPNRLEQRNGRIDRFQQREAFVGIRTLVLDDPLDAALLYLIKVKADAMREAYGFVPPFLANPDILLYLSDPAAAYREQLQQKARGGQMDLFGSSPGDGEALRELDPELARLAAADISDAEHIERMVDDSFYGQPDVTLTTVEDALARTREQVGSVEAVGDFVQRALRDSGTKTSSKTDGTFEFVTVPDHLNDVVQPGRRYSFDPLLGIDDAQVDVIDLAHPLVRRLIETIIERSQLPESAGRVAMRISPAAEGITAVAHVLFRYVANGNPPVLLEEVAEVAWRLADGTEVDPQPLLAGAEGRGSQDPADIVDDARRALDDPGLQDRLRIEGNARAVGLASRHADLAAGWAEGLDDVALASLDLVALTLVYPQVSQ